MKKLTKENTVKNLHRVHIGTSNTKCNLLGIYHNINGKYLQSYQDEFYYKLNPRHFGDKLFDKLVVTMSDNYWFNYD